MNNRYKELINVYNMEISTSIGIISFTTIIYLFLTGFCIGDLPTIWSSTVFVLCSSYHRSVKVEDSFFFRVYRVRCKIKKLEVVSFELFMRWMADSDVILSSI